MQTKLKAGRYVLALSGGVDSVVLLDLLTRQKPTLDIIIAHFDHGIRPDSNKDRKLAKQLAKNYGLKFIYEEGRLGENASEDKARQARYKFLLNAVKDTKAISLITAHHQDDLIETAIINIIRGTNRRGLSSIFNPEINRPLLNYSKKEIIAYAKKHNLKWREDPSNKDVKYLRNYVRLNIMPKLKKADRQKLLKIINKQLKINISLDKELGDIITNNLQLPRLWFSSLEIKTADEVLAYWLRLNGIKEYNRHSIVRLVGSLKTASQNKKIDVFNGCYIEVGKENLALRHLER